MSIFTPQKFGENEFCLEEGTQIVVSRFRGKQSVKGVEDIAAAMREKISYLRKANSECLMLIDLTNIEKMNTEMRKVVIRSMKDLGFDKLAIFGGTPLIGGIARFLILVSGKSATIAYFGDEKSAREWLGF
jgi:hypothetical protein